LLFALSPFVTLFRELLEMRYLWQKPIGLDDARLRAFLGDVPATPLDTAVREALADLDVASREDIASPCVKAQAGKSWTPPRGTPYIAGDVRAHAV
jgi:hypothetical protein